MTLRTPRRRISPRTKLKYRAVREFFRRALGSTSQQNIKINSSIAVNVTDLKRRIVGFEQQLDKVNKHCQSFASFEDLSRKESDISCQCNLRHEIDTINEQTEPSSEKKSNGPPTKLTYSHSDDFKRSDKNHRLSKSFYDNTERDSQVTIHRYDAPFTKTRTQKAKRHKEIRNKLEKHKTGSVDDNMDYAYSTSSFHSLANTRTHHNDYPYYNLYNEKHLRQEKIEEMIPHHNKNKRCKESLKMGDCYESPYEDKVARKRRNKQVLRDIDPDFITHIIQKQYKPVKLFGRKESDFSQISAPICRDQEFAVDENIQEGSELCSCFYNGASHRHKHSRPKRMDLNRMRSVCDTRLYSSNKHSQHKHRRMRFDAYSNSDMYDLVPVKERSSPKSRRKFAEDHMNSYNYYKVVPPSPRTHRPRLNLKAQYHTELEDYMAHTKHLKKRMPSRHKKYENAECNNRSESDWMSNIIPERNLAHIPNQNKLQTEEKHIQEEQQNTSTFNNNVQYPQQLNEQINVNSDTFNKTQETEIAVDKTDRALCEIKDILQSFLHEIKKETAASQCDKVDNSCKMQDNESILQDVSTKINSNLIPNTASVNNFNVGQCGLAPYLTPFTNPCCYPVIPICPLNCSMQNGCMMPSKSFTCSNCGSIPKESFSTHCCQKNEEISHPTETDELIKEIYKFVAQGPLGLKGRCNDKRDVSKSEDKILTSRSVGGSNKNFLHDAKVGTTLKCYSKSCEAIGSRIISDIHNNTATTASYSDTLLEKISSPPATRSTYESELDTERTPADKTKDNKFSKVLRSIGLLKKKKKDVIPELSESGSTSEIEMKPKKPSFQQDITNYMMHRQQFYRSPLSQPVGQGTQRRPHDYQPLHEYPPHSCEPCVHEYRLGPGIQPGPQHQRDPRDYHPRSQDYQPRSPRYQSRPNEYQPNYHPPYNPSMPRSPSPPIDDLYRQSQRLHQSPIRDRRNARLHPSHWPSAPPFNSSFDTSYSQFQPPLCLKEIEVKSTGTQSERKMSIFKKFRKKKAPSPGLYQMSEGDQRNFSTQTAPIPMVVRRDANKPGFSWKGLQAKAMREMGREDLSPLAYSMKTKRELAAGDRNIRNAMIKKLFYKRNPFSPRNLIVKTLLGKDKSSYGDPPALFKPRMFL